MILLLLKKKKQKDFCSLDARSKTSNASSWRKRAKVQSFFFGKPEVLPITPQP